MSEIAVVPPVGIEERVEAALADLARARRTITYAELAAALQVPPPHHLRKLIVVLESLLARHAAAGRPLLAALCVSKRTGIPAPGFFAHAHALGIHDGPEEGPEAAAWHAGVLERVFSARSK
jgi:hypothetical protein